MRVPHGDGLGEVAVAKPLGALADVVQRAQQVAHIHIGQRRQQQQHGERAPGDAWALVPRQGVEPKLDVVTIGRGALQQAVAVLIARPVVLLAELVAHPVGAWLVGVRSPMDLRPVDAQRDGQAVGNRLCTLDAGRAADLGGQPVHIVHQQGAGSFFPAHGHRLLHPAHEGDGHCHGQGHEDQHQANAQRMPHGVPRAAVPRAVGVLGRECVAHLHHHGAARRRASE